MLLGTYIPKCMYLIENNKWLLWHKRYLMYFSYQLVIYWSFENIHDTQIDITEQVFHPTIIVLLDLLFLNYEQFLI